MSWKFAQFLSWRPELVEIRAFFEIRWRPFFGGGLHLRFCGNLHSFWVEDQNSWRFAYFLRWRWRPFFWSLLSKLKTQSFRGPPIFVYAPPPPPLPPPVTLSWRRTSTRLAYVTCNSLEEKGFIVSSQQTMKISLVGSEVVSNEVVLLK